MSDIVSEIVATGHAYPSEIVDNAAYIARCRFEIEDVALLAAQTRMRTRTWCAEGENSWTLARDAVARAMTKTPPDVIDAIDLVLVASATTMPVFHAPEPDNAGVADLAPLVVAELGLPSGVLGLDLKACYCTGFLRGLHVADALIRAGLRRAAVVVATEQGSRFAVAESNRSSFCFLMSDAAGAAILAGRPRDPRRRSGLVAHAGWTDAAKRDWVGIGPDARSTIMRGSRVAGATIDLLVRVARAVMDQSRLDPSRIDWLLPIQTHVQVVDAVVSALEWPAERVIWRGDVTGFAGSASIPACLSAEIERGVVTRGQVVLSIAVGAGLNCAATIYHV
jgi:3-oxoacyl-[acyl-carrier-protein] synthase-3